MALLQKPGLSQAKRYPLYLHLECKASVQRTLFPDFAAAWGCGIMLNVLRENHAMAMVLIQSDSTTEPTGSRPPEGGFGRAASPQGT
jgi:hypothetical protein